MSGSDQVVVLRDVPWGLYGAISATRRGSGTPRLHYHEGVLEIMVPGLPHETNKKRLARLVEQHCFDRGIDLEGVGSWTLRRESLQRGAEADEAYIIGSERISTAVVPDFAIEVVESSHDAGKLETYKALGVPEVWFYRDGRLEVYVLAEGFYLKSDRSRALPDLDLALVERCMKMPSTLEAVRALRAFTGDG